MCYKNCCVVYKKKKTTTINVKKTTSVTPRSSVIVLTGHPGDKQKVASLKYLRRDLPFGAESLVLTHLSSFT